MLSGAQQASHLTSVSSLKKKKKRAFFFFFPETADGKTGKAKHMAYRSGKSWRNSVKSESQSKTLILFKNASNRNPLPDTQAIYEAYR